jgi:hypothetical protein
VKQKLGIVLHLPLYEADGDSFSSRDAYGHPCTAGGALWTPVGRKFSGANDSLNCGPAEALNNLGTTGNFQFTVGVWINPKSMGENNAGRICDKTGGASRGFVLSVINTNTLQFSIYVGGVQKAATLPGNSIPTGVWSYVSGTFNALNVIAGVNSSLTVGAAAAGPLSSHAADSLIIGNRLNSDRCFDGLISEVALYNRALSPGEIQSHYLASKWRYQ